MYHIHSELRLGFTSIWCINQCMYCMKILDTLSSAYAYLNTLSNHVYIIHLNPHGKLIRHWTTCQLAVQIMLQSCLVLLYTWYTVEKRLLFQIYVNDSRFKMRLVLRFSVWVKSEFISILGSDTNTMHNHNIKVPIPGLQVLSGVVSQSNRHRDRLQRSEGEHDILHAWKECVIFLEITGEKRQCLTWAKLCTPYPQNLVGAGRDFQGMFMIDPFKYLGRGRRCW